MVTKALTKHTVICNLQGKVLPVVNAHDGRFRDNRRKFYNFFVAQQGKQDVQLCLHMAEMH